MSRIDELLDELASYGWKRTPSTQGWALSPEIATHWQRWEGEGILDWIELPATMPLELVVKIICSQGYLPVNNAALKALQP